MVLSLHRPGLLPVALANPRTLRVVTPHRVRKAQARGDVSIITEKVPTSDLTTYFRIPSTTVAKALIDCRDFMMPDRLVEAAGEARRQGLLLAPEYDTVMTELTGSS